MTCNIIILDIYMTENINYKDVIKYSLIKDKAVIPKLRNGKRAKAIIIGNKRFRYNKDKPLSNKIKEKLLKLHQTPEFRSYDVEKNARARETINKKLTSHAIKRKAVIKDEQSALKAYTNQYTISNIRMDGLKGLSYFKYQFEKLNEYLKVNKGMKILSRIHAKYFDVANDEIRIITIQSRRDEVLNEDDLRGALRKMPFDIMVRLDEAQFWMSGLSIEKIEGVTIFYDKFNPTRAGKHIELPRWVSLKKACINIKNDDDMCFKYCVQCIYHKINEKVHPERISHYKNLTDDIKWDNINFPVSLNDINRFEEINDGKFSINVYVINDDESISPYRTTKTNKAEYHIDLIKVDDKDTCDYVLVRNYDRLIGNQTNKHKEKTHHCRTCLHGFKTKELLDKHYENGCMVETRQQIVMPKEYEKIRFKNHFKKQKFPFVIYADFECLTEHKDKDKLNTSKTEKYQEHKPCGYMMNVVNSIDETSKQYMYRGSDCMDRFCDDLNLIREEIIGMMDENKKIEMTEDDNNDFNNATHCFICGDKFKDRFKNKTEALNLRKVRDHCHFTGKYRGCAHSICNLNYCHKHFKVPVFFHNLKNYDGHLIIKHANQISKGEDINVIAQNSEKFITFGFQHLQVKDSFSFLTSSLEKLVAISKYDDSDKPNKNEWKIRDGWENNFTHSSKSDYVKSSKDLNLLTEKGVYPYDYMNNFDRFNEEQLPSKEDFYSKLSGEHISDEDYERAKIIWKHFNLKNMGEYHDLYLTTDVLLLTDIFENFRKLCMNYYGLDPAYYYTLPNFAWDAMLLQTGITIDMAYDLDMYEMIEKGLRGGITQVAKKKVEANNKYMGKSYDKNKETSFISYLDANNLYGLAMSQKLPYKNLRWETSLPTEEMILNYRDENRGYILEVDLEYPKELHDYHSDYPLAPEIINITTDMLSDYQKDLYSKIYSSEKKEMQVKDEKTTKLILNLNDKDKYVVHIKTLKFYLQHGLKLKKVHRCIGFDQKEWLKPYIDFNTGKRKEAKSDFEKDLFKLMNNAVYGKTMEDKKKHKDFELVQSSQKLEKLISSPQFRHSHIINEELVGVEKVKMKLKLDKPMFIGMSILDLSKLHMYSFYYDVLKEHYKDNINLVYTDTDSFVLHTRTDDIYEDFNKISHHFDFSNYPEIHKSYDKTNKKVLGKFKSEETEEITHFIGLRPKCYAYKVYDEEKERKKAKGTLKRVVKNELNYDKYDRTLMLNEKFSNRQNSIRSYKHNIFSITQDKVSLTSFCNKRYWYNNISSVPYGHYSIN